jgi:peptidoglycan/LPS O-acetylase OafA/YrhL
MTGRGYRPEIDGLRAIAVVSVVLYHAGAGTVHAGFVGVDVFFVISGYLITALLYREWQTEGRIDLAAFYVRRVRRILPAVWLVVAVTLAAAALLLSPIEGQPQGVAKSAVAALGFFANVYFQNTTGGYFDVSSSELPLLHLWSLSVEEQFYFLWPLLLIGLLRWSGGWARAIVAALCMASLLLCEHWIVAVPTYAFYEMPARWWELGVGALVALQAPRPLRQQAVEVLAGIGLAVVLVSVFVAWPAGHFPGAGALGATVGTGLLLFTIHHAGSLGPVGTVLRSRPAVFFGLISYSLYLWHWPLLAIDRAMRLEPTPPANRAGLVAAAVLLAWLSYRFVETPFRRKRPDLPRSRVLVAGAVASLFLCACAGIVGWMARGAGHDNSIAAAAVADKPANIAACHFKGDARITALKPSSCNSMPGVTPRVAIWGDSHALAWQPYAYGWAAAAQQSAASWTLDACPPALGYPGLTERADPLQVCRNFNQLILDQVKSGHIETLILAGRWLRYLYDIPDNFVESNDVADPAWRATARASLESGLKATLDEVAPRVGRVILLGPVPQLRQDAVRCLQSGQAKRCSLSRAEFDAKAKPALALLLSLAAGHDNVTLVDPSDFFCTPDECPVARDGYSLYWDNNHVSSTAARNFLRSYLDSHPGAASAPVAR